MFASGKHTLLPSARSRLGQVAEALLKDEAEAIDVVEGHTDLTGTPAANQELSRKRAEAVRDYLVERGVPADRITADRPRRRPAGRRQQHGRGPGPTIAAWRSSSSRARLAEPSSLVAREHALDLLAPIAVDDAALELERRRQLILLLAEAAWEHPELAHALDARRVAVHRLDPAPELGEEPRVLAHRARGRMAALAQPGRRSAAG